MVYQSIDFLPAFGVDSLRLSYRVTRSSTKPKYLYTRTKRITQLIGHPPTERKGTGLFYFLKMH